MTPERLTDGVELYQGDCLEVLKTMPAGSVDAVVTDPPYALTEPRSGGEGCGQAFAPRTEEMKERRRGGFMGQAWDSELPGVPHWQAVHRVLKPGGYMVAFGGSRTHHRLTCAIEDAGFEIRDCLMWLYGTGFPKGKGCLKPAYEPIILARRPGPKVLPLGVDECLVPVAANDSVPAFDRGDRGRSREQYRTGNSARTGETSTAGRYPANVLHDGSDEVMEAFAAFGESKSPKGTQKPGVAVLGVMNDDGWKPRERTFVGHGDTGTAARFFYCAKASRSDRGDGNTHPTVKPTELMRWLVRLVCPAGGTVLDPFGGSGSTGKACQIEGRRCILIEREPTYCDIIRKRLVPAASPQPSVFD